MHAKLMEATKTLGKYTLVRHIATGGMAEIWLAEQAGPGGFAKELVIKQILPHLAQDDQFTRMFLDEARLAAQLSHPKIAQIYELGEVDEKYFIAMEFIDGVDLCDLLELAGQKGQFIPFNIIAKIMMDMLEALDYAHDFRSRDGTPYNLVHRDVTPHNVIVSNDGIVKLVDFGVAKAKANQSKTQTGAVKGKFAYMAPEQIQNQNLDRRADLFAAGVVFYELATGQKPFGDDLAAISNILGSEPPDIRTLRRDTPDGIVAIIAKALKKDREERYLDGHEMLRDIEAWLRDAGEYVGDRRLSAWIRQMQGLPTVRHTGAVASPSPSPSAPVATPEPQPVHTPQPMPRLTTPVEGHKPLTLADQIGPTGELPVIGPQGDRTDTTGMDSESGSNTGLIVAFVVLTLAIIAAGGGVFYFVALKNADNGTKEVVEKPAEKTVKTDPKVKIPAEFQHPDGKLVYISSREPGTVYFKGELVGKTPVQTNLRPGSYEVEFKYGKKKKTHTFEVTEGGFQQTVQLKH